MSDCNEPFGYIAVRRNAKNAIDGFAVMPDRDKLEKWKFEATGHPTASSVEPASDKSTGDSKESCASGALAG